MCAVLTSCVQERISNDTVASKLNHPLLESSADIDKSVESKTAGDALLEVY